MIVVDTNIIAYLYLPTEFTAGVERLLALEPQWAAPLLWRSELRNILALYLRNEILDFETACAIQHQAENLIGPNEYDVDSLSVLRLSHASGCSAYDCEFVALAQALNTPLVTADKKLLKSFPRLAISAADFLG